MNATVFTNDISRSRLVFGAEDGRVLTMMSVYVFDRGENQIAHFVLGAADIKTLRDALSATLNGE